MALLDTIKAIIAKSWVLWQNILNELLKWISQTGVEFVTFGETLTADSEGWEGYCLVQRIEPVRLSNSGKHVKLYLRSSSGSPAYIDRIYISRADPAGELYASAADLTAVTNDPGFVPFGGPTILSFAYNLDKNQPLLIAVDFTAPPPPSGIRYTNAVQPYEASAYYVEGAQAAKQNRTGFTPYPGIYFIEKIEVSP
jgi:hypothetical protein